MVRIRMLGLALIGAVFSVFAAENNYWQAVDGNLNGRWNDAAHWSLGHQPASGEIAVIDPLSSGGSSANIEIAINEAYSADSMTIGDPGNTTRNQSVRFTGSGSLELMGKGQSQFIIRSCTGGVVFDGPSFVVHGSAGILNYSRVTVRNGSSLYCDGKFSSWKQNDYLVIDDGGSFSSQSFRFENNGGGHSVTVKTGGSFICRDQFSPEDDAVNLAYPFALFIEGGSAQIKTLKLTRAASFLKMTSGSLTLTNKPELAADGLSQVQILGGTLRLGFNVVQSEDDPWYQFLATHPDLDSGCAKLQMNDGLTTNTGVRFRHDGTFYASQFLNLSTAASMQVDCRRIVFDGNNAPFWWNGTGTRITHLYGPTEIRVDGRDFTQGYQNCYLYCHGKVVVDLHDWSNPEILRTVRIRGFHSADGTLDLTIRGKGGAMTLGSAYAYESFSSLTVEEGVGLSLGDRSAITDVGKTTEWGPISTESLTLDKDVTVNLTAGLQHLCASRWAIDPSVRIRVSIPDTTLTHGAYPVLVDLDSKDLPASLMNQIELVDLPEGWALENAYGQISVYRRDPTEVGQYGTWEWTGAAGDGKWSTAGNWQGGTSPSEGQIHVFGASDRTGVDHDGTATGGSTVGTIRFQEEAVQTFTISNKQMTYGKSEAISSYSWVPQCLKTGLRMTGGDRTIYACSVGPVYLAAGKDMDIKSGGTGSYICNGDVRMGCRTTSNVQSLKMAVLNRSFPSFRTALTVVSGGDIRFNRQKSAFGIANTTLRVSKGGLLQFTAGSDCFYQWTATPASIVVDGTLNIGVPFRGGANQNYRGSGRLNITGGTVSTTANSVISFGEQLQVYPTTWSTVTAGAADRAIAMGANSGAPVIHVGDGWTYGPAADVTPAVSDGNRAFLLANGAVATIEANGGTVRFVDGVRGFGTLAVTNGTLMVEASCSADEVTLAARKGAVLALCGPQRFGTLETAGATLRLSGDAVVTVAKSVDLTDTTLDLGTDALDSWRTVLIAENGSIVGEPTLGRSYKMRTLETEAGLALQFRSDSGLTLIVR